MPTFTKFECLGDDMASKVHDFENDTFKWYFTNTAPDPAADTVLTDLPTETANGNGYTTGGITANGGLNTTRAGGTTTVSAASATTVTATGGSIAAFRYLVLYNFTAAGKNLVGYLDHGTTLTPAVGESYTIPAGALFTVV